MVQAANVTGRRRPLELARAALVLAMLLLLPTQTVCADEALLDRWFALQAKLETWSADFTQTRTLKALKEPLKTDGRVWFAAPGRFRWELGNPAQTIAVREETQMLVVYPRLKRAERYPMEGEGASQWRDALLLIESGLPRSREELASRFRQESFAVTGETASLVLRPKSAQARRLIGELRIEFHSGTLALTATELRFADGSTLRNDFRNQEINPVLAGDQFKALIDDSYQVKEPLAGRGR